MTAAPGLPAWINDEITDLLELGDEDFAAGLLNYVQHREPLHDVAFRSPRVVRRTAQAAGRLLQHRSLTLQPDENEAGADFRRRVKALRSAVSEELRLAQLIIQGDDARAGRVPMADLPDDDFAAALIAYVTDRDPLQVIAFRHPQVARRTAEIADRLLRDHGPLVQAVEGESRNAFERRAKNARSAMQLELRLVRLIVQGDDARMDRVPSDPSPRARAARRLIAAFPEPFLTFRREEEAKDAQVRRQAKARRRKK